MGAGAENGPARFSGGWEWGAFNVINVAQKQHFYNKCNELLTCFRGGKGV